MFKKYSTAVSGAFGVTFFLFLGMHYLIAPDVAEKRENKKYTKITLGEVREPDDLRTKIRKPDRPEKEVFDPGDPEPLESDTENTTPFGFPTAKPMPPTYKGPRRIALADGDMQPIQKFAPAYPRILIGRGIEGYVIVKFTVNKQGGVENIIVIESTHNGFNNASIKAVQKFKYKPRVIDGIAMPTHNVMEKVSFVIEDS